LEPTLTGKSFVQATSCVFVIKEPDVQQCKEDATLEAA